MHCGGGGGGQGLQLEVNREGKRAPGQVSPATLSPYRLVWTVEEEVAEEFNNQHGLGQAGGGNGRQV